MSSYECIEKCPKCGFDNMSSETYSWGGDTANCYVCGYHAESDCGKVIDETEGEGAYAIYNKEGSGILGTIVNRKKFIKGFYATTIKDKSIATAFMTIKSEEGQWLALDLLNGRIKRITEDTIVSHLLFEPIGKCKCMSKRCEI